MKNNYEDHKLRIAIIIGQLGIGGTEKQVYGLVKNFNHHYINVTVICTSSQVLPYGDLIRRIGIPLYVIDSNKSTIFKRIRSLIVILREFSPDVLHSFGDSAGVFATIAAVVLKLCHVHSVRSFYKGRGIILSIARNIVCRCADIVTANSYALGNIIRRSLLLSNTTVMITPNGVDCECFVGSDMSLDSGHIRSNYNKLILYIGREHPSKDLKTLVQIIKMLDEKSKNFNYTVGFVLIGYNLEKITGSFLSRVKNINLIYTGEITNIKQWISVCDLIILTSLREGMPNAVLEAMAASRTVICTIAGGCSEAILNNHNGFLVKTRDAASFVDSIIKILNDEELCRRMGRNGYERAVRNFNWNNSCKSMINAYTSAISKCSKMNPLRRILWGRHLKIKKIKGFQ